MIRNWPAGRTTVYDAAAQDVDGTTITATAAAFEIRDEDGVSLATGSATLSAGRINFTVPLQAVTLVDGTPSSGREIVLRFTTAAGIVEIVDYAVVVNQHALTRYQNTILTYPEALSLRHRFGPTLEAWDASENDARIAALINAHYNLSRVTYSVSNLKEGTRDKDYAAYGEGCDEIFDLRRRVRLSTMNAVKFAELPRNFQEALKRAQLVEADVILGGDQISKTREAGIISETIGESSTFYNSKPFLNLPMSRRSYEILKSFIPISVKIGR